MKVAIYTRVSSAEQANEGYSIHEQKKKLISYCEIHDWNEYKVFTDAGISGGSMKRPALQNLMKQLSYFDLVLVYKLDRLTRNVRDLLDMLEEFEQYNVSFKSATEVFDTTSAIGKLFITMVGAMAEWERETIRERSLFGSRAAVREGIYIREAPFCYDNIEGKLHPNEYAKVIDLIVSMFKKGISANEIARRLNSSKVHVPNKKSWNRNSLIRLMRSPVLRGHTKYGDMLIENTHEPVLSEHDYNAINNAISSKTHKSKVKHHAIFRGALMCPQCNRRLHLYAGTVKDRKGYKYDVRRYKCETCSKNKDVKNVSFNESEVENKFVNLLKSYELNKFHIRKVEPVKKIEYDIDKINKQKINYTRSWSLGYIEDDEYFELMEEINATKKMIEEQTTENKQSVSKEQIQSINNFILKGWEELTIKDKEELILSTVDKIEFNFIPKDKKHKTNTLDINNIHFKF